MRTTSCRVLATTARYADAACLLKQPGDCVLVDRSGVRRQLVVQCPDGCGEVLSVNLDKRSGPAWRIYEKGGKWSLFPSIDKPSGCLSHFILWNGRVIWCDRWDGDDEKAAVEVAADRILQVLEEGRPVGFVEIADRLAEIPWDVLTACRRLAREGVLREGTGIERGSFWISSSDE